MMDEAILEQIHLTGQSSAGSDKSSAATQKGVVLPNYGTTSSPGVVSSLSTLSAITSDNSCAPNTRQTADVCAPGRPGDGSRKVDGDATDAPRQPWEPGPGDRPMYDGPDMPSMDLPEDHHGPEPQQIPLDVSRLVKIRGYEDVGYHSNSGMVVQWVKAPDTDNWQTCLTQGHWFESLKDTAPAIPPPFDNIPQHDEHKQPEEQYSSISHINDSQAREALVHFASEKCCYGKSAAKDMLLHKIAPSSALHYTLDTYTEMRATTWEQEPYKGQVTDGPENGSAPPPWDIHCNPTQMFHDEVHAIEVPHTATVIACHGCASLGWVRCHGCMGRGFKRCMYCHGTGRIWKTDAHGHRHTETCWHCHGTGRKRCLPCGGDGRLVCRTCAGFRQLKCYIKLTVTYTNNAVECIVDHTDMPDHLHKEVSGEFVFQQTQPRVWPITRYPDLEMCRTSQKLVSEQQNSYPDARIIMQRQRLRAVPVSECSYNYRDREGRFWVYGKESAIYAPDYPQKCCWGCVIL